MNRGVCVRVDFLCSYIDTGSASHTEIREWLSIYQFEPSKVLFVDDKVIIIDKYDEEITRGYMGDYLMSLPNKLTFVTQGYFEANFARIEVKE